MTKGGEKKIPLFDIKLSARAKREVAQTLESGWLTSGPKVVAFEKAVATYLEVRYAAAVNSCTAGLQLVLRALGIGRGKEVITSPFTFVATAEAILSVGARPIFADISPTTLNIDPDEVARKMSVRTVAILPVDVAGCPADYEALNRLCDGGKLPLIADAAHSFGATVGDRSIARMADAAVYSFYSTKNLTAGEGGMVVSRHKDLIHVVRTLARHGLTSDAHIRKTAGKQGYDALGLGLKANMSDVHAAIGLGQLTVFDRDQARRGRLAKRYSRNLADLDELVQLPEVTPPNRHAWHMFIIKLHLSKLKIDRDQFIRAMARRGIECGVHFKPVFDLSYYRESLGLSQQFFPNATYAGRRVVTLPLYPSLSPGDVDRVCEAVRDILSAKRRRR